MRTKTLKKNKINVITLGCSKNVYDSEVLMGQLKASGKEVVHEEEGNIVVINTCGFINNAKEESVNTILDYMQKKEDGEVDKVFVTGCLSERYKPDLMKEIPNVDQYFGTTELPQLLKALGADYKHELIGERLTTTPKNYAYLKIAEGCDRPCSFCAIPLMRGKHKSTSIENLVIEAEKLAANGVKELILIAQDLTYYGLDIYKKRNLAELLEALVKVEGVEWIRMHYAFPTGFPMDVLDVMVQYDTILILMNGTGIFQTIKSTPKYLTHLKSLLSPGGQILIDSSDIKYMYKGQEKHYLVENSDKYYGELDYYLSYRGVKEIPMKWLYLDFLKLKTLSNSVGLTCKLMFRGPHHDYLAKLS